MTDLEISKALALAIGYLPEHVRAYAVGSINYSNSEGELQVFRHDGVYGVHRTECNHLWNTFRYTDWNVISPIAEKFDCFPMKRYPLDGTWFSYHPNHGQTPHYAKTPQKAIAMAVIGAMK